MAASSGLRSASPGPSACSERNSDTNYNADDVIDDGFGSFAAAEPLSDPFGDVYGIEADFGAFQGGSESQEASPDVSLTTQSSSFMSFSPLVSNGGPPTLVPSLSGEIDPFADVAGGFRDTTSYKKNEEKPIQLMDNVERKLTIEKQAGALNSTTRGILDMALSTKSQETAINSSTLSTTSVKNATTERASPSSNFVVLPPLNTSDATTDLLSFSPLQATVSTDPFFELENDIQENSAAACASNSDDVFPTTATPPPSLSSSTSASLRRSFAALHDDAKPPGFSTSLYSQLEAKAALLDPFAARMTPSLVLSHSSVDSIEAMEDVADLNGVRTLMGTCSRASPEAESSLSATPSVQRSFVTTDPAGSFASAAEEVDSVDPFAAAGLAAPDEVPLAEALATWTTAADTTVEENENDNVEEKNMEDTQKRTSANAPDETKPEHLMDTLTIVTERSDSEETDGEFTTKHQTTEVCSSNLTTESDVKDWVNEPCSRTNDRDNVADDFQSGALDVAVSDDKVTVTTENESRSLVTGADGRNNVSALESAAASTNPTSVTSDQSPSGMFSSSSPEQQAICAEDDEFGDFVESAPMSASAATADGDTFGDFAWNVEPSEEDDFGNFGDFEQSSINDFDDFQQSSGANDTGFGDFSVASAPSAPALSLTKSEWAAFFEKAFPTKELPAPLPHKSKSPQKIEMKASESTLPSSMDVLHDMFRSAWKEFISMLPVQQSSSSGSCHNVLESNSSDESVPLNTSTKRASKYLRYVLSEKIQEASKQNGIFTHGSEQHQMYVRLAASGDAERMYAALKELQDALFHHSVHEAMMRIAKQAALSAKAKIAEQAAQQQGNSRGGSLFSTTRHLLSRGNTGSSYGPGTSGSDIKAELGGADTPTGASIPKSARHMPTNQHEASTTGQRGTHTEERGSEGSDHTVHSSGSDSEVVSTVDSRARSHAHLSSNGGLMKKFQDRFSFASSKQRPRFVGLRKKGQAVGEVRQMELNLDAISGGLDEVKWKCALFLYDVEEVTHVAPAQIKLVAYPSKQPLTGKTDRSAITKLIKPGTIWTVDIQAEAVKRNKK
ncbi:hypothetical protein PsorP6_001928 [Peronosclerospora sorghi]|uniref:Uncharacterized protein n=1 Tax=Peronosclerospora sorghi TaxID=230839 RepID=A0ACC0WVN6_9STRA|nr:hypothetical protein PsorP6_001928 [Peronosclerospora sorghi]